MADAKNILFIMCDQLRWDYLSCYGHPHLHTPNIDRLAAQGIRFDNAYVQSPICGPSRASIYSGRYPSSNGATVNFAPLRVDELTMGDYLNPLGMRTVLAGKTHLFADQAGLERLEVPEKRRAFVAQGGFEAQYRDDGLHPDNAASKNQHYNVWLREQGYSGDNPWLSHANSTVDASGKLLNGWFLEAARWPANIKEEHSETPYTVMRAREFMETADETPWCLHLSFIKPHWPVVAPAPYHAMYNRADLIALNQDVRELENPHPIFEACMTHKDSQMFAQQQIRDYVLPAYMGLIKQIDDQLGELFHFMEQQGLMKNTMIVFTSDHGDYLGDHYLGEKDFFHDCAARVPLLIYDPSKAADTTRGTTETRPVELLDLLPTFIEVAGGTPHFRLEGRSLLPLLHGKASIWRDVAVSEIDFGDRRGPRALGLAPDDLWSIMLVDEHYKYIAFHELRPVLFDRQADPKEINDLGEHSDYENIRNRYRDKLLNWFMRPKRPTLSETQLDTISLGVNREKKGVLIAYWDEDDLPADVRSHRQRASGTDKAKP